jgi:hypothetical protein
MRISRTARPHLLHANAYVTLKWTLEIGPDVKV